MITLVNTIRTVLCPSFENCFKQSEIAIQRQVKHLELQIQTAEICSSHKREKELRTMLQSSLGNVQQYSMKTSLPFRFLQERVPRRFFGREDVLARIEKLLASSKAFGRQSAEATMGQDRKLINRQAGVSSVVIHGLGGLGKSSVALAYVYRHFHHFKAILWLFADTAQKLETQFVQLYRLLGLGSEDGNTDHCRSTVLHWMSQLGEIASLHPGHSHG